MEVDDQDNIIYQEETQEQGIFVSQGDVSDLITTDVHNSITCFPEVNMSVEVSEEPEQARELVEAEEPLLAVNGNTGVISDEEEKIAVEMAEVLKGLQEVVSEEGSKRKFQEDETEAVVPESQSANPNTTNDEQISSLPNGVTVSDDLENPDLNNSSDGPTPAKKAHIEINVRKLLPDLEKLWKPVEDDPSDFTAWTYLLQYVDQENEVLAARDAYDGFLARYPYCYGYWKKYADFEKRKGSAEDCEKVFQRGLKAIPLSVDLWIHYLNYVKATHESDQAYVREQFDKAIQTVGMEFRSDKLWEQYIQYEKEGGHFKNLMALYDQLLATPTQLYIQHFNNVQEFINSHNPEEIFKAEEYAELKTIVLEELAAPAGETEEDAGVSSSDVETKIREKTIERRTEIHKKTEEDITARWSFEEAIKRPYFHVKPLEKGQLKMWKEYLDFEIEKGNEKRILILFERCLIACALYEEYWVKYVKYLQGQTERNVEKLREVYTRACTIHHSGKPWINLHWAAFEEAEGNLDQAVEILEKLEKAIPDSLHLYFRRINLERRRGNITKCVELFEKYIAEPKHKGNLGHIKIKYARFLVRLLNDYDKAKTILQESIGEDESTRAKTIMALIDLAMDQNPIDFQVILSSFDQALESNIPNEQKVTFAHRKIEFLEDYSSDMDSIEKAHGELQSIAKQLREKKDPRSGDDGSKTANGGAYPGSGGSVQFNQGGSGSTSNQAYNQHGQYSNWNYQTSGGYGYNSAGWSAYQGFYN